MDKPVDDIATRLAAFRAELKARGLDGFIVPLTDEHQSEYVPEYAQRLAWLTGFTGSAGSAAILADKAAVFIDGRYTLQAEAEVDGALYERCGVPETSPAKWLKKNAAKGARIGYDPALHTIGWVEATNETLAAIEAELVPSEGNPVDPVWADQPGEPLAAMVPHGEEYAGKSAAEKREELAAILKDKGAETAVLTALDSIAWAFNLRGSDVAHTPVAVSFAAVHADGTADLYVHPDKVTAELRTALGNAVAIHDKTAFEGALAALGKAGRAVMVDPKTASAAVLGRLEKAGAKIVKADDPCLIPKARKNAVEIAGTRSAHERDGVAVTRFLHWLSEVAPSGQIDEIGAARRLLEFRREDDRFRDTSFDTISGAGPNGAIVHYRVSEKTNRGLGAGMLYLVDSGAQYLDGTTDITRTVAVLAPGAAAGTEERDRFTRVLKGHIALATCVFPKGTTGSELDSFARRPLWEAGLDYDHGTGHGVGSYLAVHEGPGRIAKVPNTVELDSGMIFSNEPGFYKTGAYGIRIENLVLVVEAKRPGDRKMLGFEELTLAPIDRNLIEVTMLTPPEVAWLDAYHARVRKTLSPHLPREVRAWLAEQTAPIAP